MSEARERDWEDTVDELEAIISALAAALEGVVDWGLRNDNPPEELWRISRAADDALALVRAHRLDR